MAVSQDFAAHLASGITTLARCWRLTRRDGVQYGFTDHDCDLAFDGTTFEAGSGLTAHALQQTTGLAIDNSEAIGALTATAVSEADIEAGRFDGAEVEAWLVNWAAPEQRVRQFRGKLGELTRGAGAFRAELLGLSEALNQPQGRVYQTPCAAVFGDGACKLDANSAAYSGTGVVAAVEDRRQFRLSGLETHADGWFRRGRMEVLSGAARGLSAVVKSDTLEDGLHNIELWEAIPAGIVAGDEVRLQAGCDKTLACCRDKFCNVVNYRGFPSIPGEDKLLTFPVSSGSGGGRK